MFCNGNEITLIHKDSIIQTTEMNHILLKIKHKDLNNILRKENLIIVTSDRVKEKWRTKEERREEYLKCHASETQIEGARWTLVIAPWPFWPFFFSRPGWPYMASKYVCCGNYNWQRPHEKEIKTTTCNLQKHEDLNSSSLSESTAIVSLLGLIMTANDGLRNRSR